MTMGPATAGLIASTAIRRICITIREEGYPAAQAVLTEELARCTGDYQAVRAPIERWVLDHNLQVLDRAPHLRVA